MSEFESKGQPCSECGYSGGHSSVCSCATQDDEDKMDIFEKLAALRATAWEREAKMNEERSDQSATEDIPEKYRKGYKAKLRAMREEAMSRRKS